MRPDTATPPSGLNRHAPPRSSAGFASRVRGGSRTRRTWSTPPQGTRDTARFAPSCKRARRCEGSVGQEGQREPRCTSLLVCHAAHAHPGSSHALRGARSDGTIKNDPLAVFGLTGLFARRFWLGWGRTRHTAAVGKQALFIGETPRYTWTKEGVSVRRMGGRRSISAFSYPIFVVPLRIDVCCSASTGTPCTSCA